MRLPVDYTQLDWQERKNVRNEYVKKQKGICLFCEHTLNKPAPKEITSKKINWSLFPENFLKYPVHLQHNHDTGMTEGAVHNYCNAVMWEYFGV